jgi:O-antigen/teichoic acid export membrane protein
MMAGQFKIVDQVIVVFKTYINLFFNFAYPRVCYLVGNSIKEGLQFWRNYNGANFVFITISMAIIYIFSTDVVSYFTKTDVVQISQMLKIAVLIPFLLSISISLKQILLAFNFQQFYIKVTMILVVLNLIAIVLLMSVFKIYGVLFAIIFTEILTIVIYYLVLKEKLKQQD